MIVLDTHAWVWWVGSPDRLSDLARNVIDGATEEGVVHVSSFSAWEVALLVSHGRLALNVGTADWITQSEALRSLRFVPVSNTIALRSAELPGSLHNDPADRIIVATARSMGATLVTRDVKLREYAHVETVW